MGKNGWKKQMKSHMDSIKEYQTKSQTKDATKFKLVIPRHVMDKIAWWMHKTDKEVSGFGSLGFDEKTDTFLVKDAILLKQKVSGASAEIDPTAMAKAMFRMKDDPNGLKWHWHSHVNMGVFWSSDDMEIIRSLGQRGWILATVFNYKDERRTAYLTQVNIQTPSGEQRPHDVFVDQIETNVINFVKPELYEVWDKEYTEHVEEEKWSNGRGLTEYQKKRIKESGNRSKYALSSVYDYDDKGYGKCHDFPGGKIYNPLFDKELSTDEERIAVIDELTEEEVECLNEATWNFRDLYKKYLDKKNSDGKKELPPGRTSEELSLLDAYENGYYHD